MVVFDTLTAAPQNPGEMEERGWSHEADQAVQHATNLAANAIVMSNQLRSAQVSRMPS